MRKSSIGYSSEPLPPYTWFKAEIYPWGQSEPQYRFPNNHQPDEIRLIAPRFTQEAAATFTVNSLKRLSCRYLSAVSFDNLKPGEACYKYLLPCWCMMRCKIMSLSLRNIRSALTVSKPHLDQTASSGPPSIRDTELCTYSTWNLNNASMSTQTELLHLALWFVWLAMTAVFYLPICLLPTPWQSRYIAPMRFVQNFIPQKLVTADQCLLAFDPEEPNLARALFFLG